MRQSKLFNVARLQLAGLYAGVMGLIFCLSGVAVYQAIFHIHWRALDRELESVAGTLHDSFESNLKQPGRLEPIAQQLMLDLCVIETGCLKKKPIQNNSAEKFLAAPEKPLRAPENSWKQDLAANQQRHRLGAVYQNDYYLRLLNSSGKLIALAGNQGKELPISLSNHPWQTLKDTHGNRYHQITLPLHTRDNLAWGYMQVGRSLKPLDDHLAVLKLILVVGLPVVLLLIGGSSWWLAGVAMRPVHQSYQQMEQFTADAAHELRTPVASIKTILDAALGMNSFSEKAQDVMHAIEVQTNRLSQLIQDLMLLSRTEQRGLNAQPKPCCLNEIVNDLLEELSAPAVAGDIHLTSEIRTSKQLYVLGNEDQLYCLISNLITNAIHYTPAGGKVTVILSSSTSHQVLIQVQDTGIGIALKEHARIFDRFYRVNSDRSRNTGGSGLGLAIAQAIAKAHRGVIEVQSELGKGSSFIVRLPLLQKATLTSSP